MLWYKSWLETRWRFVIGLIVLMFSAGGTVMTYPEVVRLMPLVPNVETGGRLGRLVQQAAELSRTYPGYVWSHWYSDSLRSVWCLFAALLGSGSLLAYTSAGAVFTLSLPATRSGIVFTRAATALLELLALAVVPSLLLVLLSPTIGQRYSPVDAIVFSVCLVVAGSIVFSLAFFFSSVLHDMWRPMALTIGSVIVVGTIDLVARTGLTSGLIRAMTGESYFRDGAVPWTGLGLSAAVSVALLLAANRNIARQDF